MRKKLLEEKEKLTFLSTYGITHNRETIWQLEKRHRAQVAAIRQNLLRRGGRELLPSSRSSTTRTQLSMDFGPRAKWPMRY